MVKKEKLFSLCQGAIIAALYVVLTYLQEIIFPNSTSMAVQFRVSEALMILCVFSHSAVYGLTVGCFISNILNIGALPLDIIIGSLATFFAAVSMYKLRNMQIKNLPLLSALMPALFNGVFIGLEIEIFFVEDAFAISGFLFTALTVALGEFVVLYTLGLFLYVSVKKRSLDKKLF